MNSNYAEYTGSNRQSSIVDRLEHGIKCAREQLIHIEGAYLEGKYTENEYFPLKWTVEKILNVLEGSP